MVKWMGRDATGELCYNAIHGFNKTCPWCAHDKVIKGKQVGFEKSFADTNTYHISNSPIFHTDGSVSQLSIFRNITPLKKMETRVQQAQKMESIGNLAGGIAHDFNNILFPIIGLSEMLIEDLPKNSPENENVKEILKAGQRGSELVKQILAFSRQNEHTMTPVRVQFVMKEVLKLIRASIPMNIEINQQLQSDCGLVLADSTQIHQIGMNLITNAYHAVEGAGGKIEVQVREIMLPPESKDSSLPPGQYAMLSVSDNGVGIAPANKDKIFEPYFTTKGPGKGTGLGLSVVYGIVKEHRGEIKVYSEVGKGTTFNIYIPLMAKSDIVELSSEKVAVERGSEHILLVDDEEAISNLEKQILERLGYTVSERTSSFEALEAFRANPDRYDLVISDMSMPNMTGDALAREMLSIRPGIPIIICTGFSERVNEDLATGMGIKGFLMKPITISALANEVRRVLDKKNMS
jgi:signal transduction histidine kinase/CheY-like chemotaxis protein